MKEQFSEVIIRLLDERLKKYRDKKLDLVICTDIYQTIFGALVEVFEHEQSGIKLTNEAMNYVAQMIYDGVLINGKEELDPNIFTQRAKLENIATKEIALLSVMFNHTEFAIPMIQEIKRRN